MVKKYITPNKLHGHSVELAIKIWEDKYDPTWIVALWRGGCPIGMTVQGFLKHHGNSANHIAVRTSSYDVEGQQGSKVDIHGIEYLIKSLRKSTKPERVLIIDDIFDTGRSIEAFLSKLKQKLGDKYPEDVRVGTVFYKPANNKTSTVPNYFVEESSEWLVFPHEFEDLTKDEIKEFMGIDMDSNYVSE